MKLLANHSNATLQSFSSLSVMLPRFLSHGGFSTKFRVGRCHPQFQNVTLGYTNFPIKSALRWRFLDKTCQIFAFSGPKFKKSLFFLQKLPNFDISLTKIAKKHSIPLPRLNSTKIAKEYTVG